MTGGDGRRVRKAGVALVAVAVLLVAAYAAGWSDGRRAADRDAATAVDPVLLPDGSPLLDLTPRGLDLVAPEPRSTPDDPSRRFAAWVDRDGPARRLRVFEPTGQVLELRGRLPDAGADDLRTMWLSAEERSLVARRVRTVTAQVDASELRTASRRETRALSLGEVLSATPDDPRPAATSLVATVDDLFDLSALGITEIWEPWQPDVVTMWIRPAPAGGSAPVPWPLEAPVFAETDEVSRGPTGEPTPYRCLEGRDAATVLGLLDPAVDGAVTVVDGARTLELRLRFDFPYHVASNHPCGG